MRIVGPHPIPSTGEDRRFYSTADSSATANQTVFNVNYDEGKVAVFLNGIRLVRGSDFTSTSSGVGTQITLQGSGIATNDYLEVVGYQGIYSGNALVEDRFVVGTNSTGSGGAYNGSAGNHTTVFPVANNTGDLVCVYRNGIKLVHTTDFTVQPTASTVTLASPGANTADEITVHVIGILQHSNFVPTSGGTFTGEVVVPTLKLSSNVIKASDGGSTITLDTSDNVTIAGNATVTGNLTVSGTTTTINTTVTASDAIVVNNAGSDVGLKINSTSSGHIMQLQDNGTDVMVVKDGGNVGIGTNSPTSGYKLDVVNNGATGIRIGDTSDNSRVQYQLDNNVATTTISKDGSGFNTEYKFKTQNTAGALVDVLSLVGGNVGIGDTSPSEKLVVTDNSASKFASIIKNSHASGAGLKVVGAQATQYSFVVRDYTDNTNSLIVLGNGKVGIGLTGPNAKLHVRESGLFTNSGTDSGYSYAPTTPILTVTTDGNGAPSTTYQNNAVFKVGIGGGDAGTVTSEYFRVNVNGRIKHNDYYLPKENEVTSSGTSHNPIPFANLWGTDTTLIITMVAITWSASNGQDGGGHGYALLALDRHFGSYGTHVIHNTAPHNNSGYLPTWGAGSTGLTCTTKSAGYRFSYTILGNTSTA